MKNNDNIQRLIITDNKTMAVTIAKYFGYTEEDEATSWYDGGTEEILWTGGNLLTLELNGKTVDIKDLDNMSAEEITKACYNVVLRSQNGTISHLDTLRLNYIENALAYSDEIVFVCQPTDEGERLVQSIKLFFDIKLPMRTVKCKEFDSVGIDEGVERNVLSQRLIAYQSAKAMRNNVVNDLLRNDMVKTKDEEVSPQAMMLLSEIKKHLAAWEKGLHNPDLKRKIRMSGILDIESLYCVMNIKYDMSMEAIWQSLLYLYGKGYISNPMTHRLSRVLHSDYFGDGNPGYTIPIDTYLKYVSHYGGIYPLENGNVDLSSHECDYEYDPDDFMGQTAAIYNCIFKEMERMENREEPKIKEYPSFAEGHGLTIFEVLRFPYRESFPEDSNSIQNSFGALIDELDCAGFINMRSGYVTVTPSGFQALFDNGYT